MKPVLDIEQGEARSLPSGETKTNPYLLGETDPAPLGSGEVESIPQPTGETDPTPLGLGEAESLPQPLGEAAPPQRRRVRQRLALSPRARRSHLKGIGRGGTKFLSFEKGMPRRPYPSRSF